MRTYSGAHSTAAASNRLYRTNLAKGQTGLSIAFDLPTQTGYDPDSPMARGEVGKVGVPVAHLGHMRTLLDGIPPGRDEHVDDDQRHRGLAARAVRGQRRGAGHAADELRGTTQNDIVKEYLSRGTYIFPPEPSRRLIVDMVAWCAEHARRGTRSTSARTTSRRPGRRRCRSWPTRWPRRSACSTPCATRARCRRNASRRCSARSRSSSTPASASSRRSASCGRSPSCGTASGSSATA